MQNTTANSYCIETRGLTHRFSENETVLREVDLRVEPGSIYGFLGPNGAGKTTTLKLALGLLRKQEGEIYFFGKPFSRHRVEILSQVGSLIESPSIYAQLTAAENLEVLRKVYQCPASRITETLELVGLSHTGKKRAGKFSLGMKQRLAIAMALLHNPSLLILDEPVNGLDPGGILEMRELLKKINTEAGITVLISSHLLSEIEKLVTHVGIISKGSLIFQGSLGDLMSKQQQASALRIETNDAERSRTILSAAGFEVSIGEGGLLLPPPDRDTIAAINKRLVENNIHVYEISLMKNDLESVFMDMTNTGLK